MKGKKILKVKCTGKRYAGIVAIDVMEIYEYEITGSMLSVRRAENDAVSKFMKEHRVGSCAVTNTIRLSC